MDETNEESSFAELLDQSFEVPDRLEPGQKIESVIVKITKEWIFIDLGGKSDGCLAANEMLDDEGNLTVQEGDTIVAYFLSAKHNELLFTTKVGKGSQARIHLEEAFRSSIPVEGLVEKEIKGGYEIKVAGNVRGFCPFSETGVRRGENREGFLGESLVFKIIEYSDGGRRIILSSRAILEDERKRQKEALRDSLQEGTTVRGTITSIRDFGAFADIGGIEGLIPISEIGWGRVTDIRETLTIGQEVDLMVMSLDWEKDRFSFSLKETLPDPWERVEERYPEGSLHRGRVDRLARFGAFVYLEAGVDGLIHISDLGRAKRISHPREMLNEGQEINVRINKVDKDKRRLSLSLHATDKDEEGKDEYQIYKRNTKKESTQSLGTLGDLLKMKIEKGK